MLVYFQRVFGILERWNNNQVTSSLSKPHELSYRSNIDHLRHILLYYFRKGENAMQARKKLYDVYVEKSLTERQSQRSLTYHIYALKDI